MVCGGTPTTKPRQGAFLTRVEGEPARVLTTAGQPVSSPPDYQTPAACESFALRW